MKEMYAWVDWFQELTEVVARGTPEQLAERARQVRWSESGKAPPLLKLDDQNIDPFSLVSQRLIEQFQLLMIRRHLVSVRRFGK